MSLDNIMDKDGYLVYPNGDKVIFYECDPDKNSECNKRLCRFGEDEDHDYGFCSKTVDPKYRKDGGKAWYCVLKMDGNGGEPYWGREYIEEV